MRVIIRAACASAFVVGVAVIVTRGAGMQAQAPAAAPEQLHFHHVHLNSTAPAAAAAYYPKPFAKTATQTKFNGFDASPTRQNICVFQTEEQDDDGRAFESSRLQLS